MPKIISIANNKGGSGKTTTCYFLGLAIACAGYRVLMIDSDGQANLTDACRYHIFGDFTDPVTLGDVLVGAVPLQEACYPMTYACPRLSLVPAARKTEGEQQSQALDDVADELVLHPLRLFRLQQVLQNADADVVLIDTPPNLGALTTSALLASDCWIAPARPDVGSVDGIERVMVKCSEISAEGIAAATFLAAIATQASEHINSHAVQLQRLRQEYTCLGVVPRREGLGADRQLQDCYEEIAGKLIHQLFEGGSA